MAAGIALLAVVAVLGWTRHAGTAAPETLPQTIVTGPQEPVADIPSYAEPPSVRTISPAYSAADAAEPGYALGVAPQPASSAAAAPAPSAQPGSSYVYPSEPRSRRRVVERERPLSHSLEIVGGSAGAGAAIGAVAGGGKGAGIGALSGGAAGFIYDRLTHKKQVTVEQ
jgi:hypothetical protein